MATSQYLSGRKKYGRPQAMLWSEFEPIVQSGFYVPAGFEVGQTTDSLDPSLIDSFIILSDDNRDKLDFSIDRLEKRERMINGRMRSYHIAYLLLGLDYHQGHLIRTHCLMILEFLLIL